MANTSLSFDNLVFSQFAFYAAVVLLKTLLMSTYTSRFRIAKKVFANPEDYLGGPKREIRQPPFDDDVERVRRCHLNDLENVLPFVLLGFLYVLTGPDPWIAALHFRMFTGCRIFHTIAYLTPLPQPSRFLGFVGGLIVNISMTISVLRVGIIIRVNRQ
ncbi:hypothetical protein KUTeg_022007 [Tegillarca granosa]|uniref:Microsomal glutathione S-transferase 1 n=1 Tax=Tegillarca granosa TaxID=220873 RepID=A0ABQ9E507_TEGGR|nr:hypothetical protein KUTeg_022007 [Tegillarca granosa]